MDALTLTGAERRRPAHHPVYAAWHVPGHANEADPSWMHRFTACQIQRLATSSIFLLRFRQRLQEEAMQGAQDRVAGGVPALGACRLGWCIPGPATPTKSAETATPPIAEVPETKVGGCIVAA